MLLAARGGVVREALKRGLPQRAATVLRGSYAVSGYDEPLGL